MAKSCRVSLLALILLCGCELFESESKNANLAELSISGGTLSPAFDPAVGRYSVTVDASTGSITVQARAEDGGARVSIDGSYSVEPGVSATITLSVGTNEITVFVTAENGRVQKIYRIVVTRPAPSFSVGGSVAGLSGELTLQNNGADDLVITTDGSFSFPTELADGSNYNVTVLSQPAGQDCSVENASGTIDGSDATDVSVTCAATTFSIGGTLSGLTGSVTLQNNGSDDLVLSENGEFTFSMPLDDGDTYDVTVSSQPANQQCTVSNGTGTVSGADVTSVDVQCNDTGTFLVGGTVNGLVGTGVLQLNGSDNLLMTKVGPFAFSVGFTDGADFEVTVLTQPAGQTCTVANGSGTISAGNALEISVDCTGAGAASGSPFDWEWVNPRPRGNPLADFATNGSLLVGVGVHGLVQTSTDGVTWTERDAGTGELLASLAWGGGRFVAVGEGGTIATSPDGVAWQVQSLGFISFRGVEWNGSMYVAVGNVYAGDPRIVSATSPNGETWSLHIVDEVDPGGAVEDLAWNGAAFAATASPGLVYTSTDAITWTSAQLDQTAPFGARIASDGSRFVVISGGGTVYTSPDGTTWTAEPDPYPGGIADDLTWDGSRFLAVALTDFVTSPDASTWTVNTVIPASSGILTSVASFAGQNIVGRSDGAIYTSPDDSSWSTGFTRETPRLSDVTWDGGQFVAVGVGPGIRTSPDGINWTTRLETDPLVSILQSVIYAGGQYVAVGNGSEAQILTSPDAITWTTRSIAIADLRLNDVAWGGDTYVAVNSLGSVLTSSDGVSWAEQSFGLNDFGRLSSAEWNGNLWVVTGYDINANNRPVPYVWTSPDAANWTQRALPAGLLLSELAWNGSRFVAVGAGPLATSVDGLNWTFLSTQLPLSEIIWTGSEFLVVGFGPEILTSTDGQSWSVSRSRSGSYTGIASGGGATVVLGTVGQGTILTRTDP